MKKSICLILSAIIAVSLLASCGISYKEPPSGGFVSPEQFAGYKLGNMNELVPELTITSAIEDADITNYTSVEEGLSDLSNKKLHGFILPAVYAKNEIENSYDFLTTQYPLKEMHLRGIALNSFKLLLPVDAALTSIEKNGTIQKIANAHSPYADPADVYTRPTDYEKFEGRTITIGICSDDAFPYNYRAADGTLVGINVDIAHEIAAGTKAELVIKEYSESGLMPALDAGDVDIILSKYHEDVTNPIDTKYIYTHSYCDASTYILIRSPLADVIDKKQAVAETKK